jgi:rhamnogalacturonyl hydrolase YesR
MLLLFILSFSGCTLIEKEFWTEDSSPVIIGKRISEELLSRKEFMMYIADHSSSVHYAEVCAAFGAARLAGLMNNVTILKRLADRYMKVITDSIYNSQNHVDANVYGILPLELFMQSGDSVFYKQGIELADIQWANPLENGLTRQTRFWIDDIWMIGSLQVQAFRATKNEIYLNRAALEINAYLDNLQQPNGLFHHGENAPFFWGRGNGWVAAGLAELLSELPKNNQHYNNILEGYKKMMTALLDYQAEDGMWRQLIDYSDSWKETSSTAMFGYAMSTGIKRGILPKEKFEKAYQKAWLSLVKYVNDEGKLTDICVGTGQSRDANYYLERPRHSGDFHGQAPMLWFAYRLLEK